MLKTESLWVPVVLFAFFFVSCRSAQISPKELADDIKHSISLQSTPEQVTEYLNGRMIEHSAYVDNSITAIIRDKSKWAVVKTDYGVVFRFDAANRLSNVDVHEYFTGP